MSKEDWTVMVVRVTPETKKMLVRGAKWRGTSVAAMVRASLGVLILDLDEEMRRQTEFDEEVLGAPPSGLGTHETDDETAAERFLRLTNG